jgi:hypothetical protein
MGSLEAEMAELAHLTASQNATAELMRSSTMSTTDTFPTGASR